MKLEEPEEKKQRAITRGAKETQMTMYTRTSGPDDDARLEQVAPGLGRRAGAVGDVRRPSLRRADVQRRIFSRMVLAYERDICAKEQQKWQTSERLRDEHTQAFNLQVIFLNEFLKELPQKASTAVVVAVHVDVERRPRRPGAPDQRSSPSKRRASVATKKIVRSERPATAL